MSVSVYQNGNRVSLTLLSSGYSGGTPDGTAANGSGGFESPSPIAQAPSFSSAWRLPHGAVAETDPKDGHGAALCLAGQPAALHLAKGCAAVLSPSPDSGNAGSSAEFTRENVTGQTRSHNGPHGASESQERCDDDGGSRSGHEPQQQQGGSTGTERDGKDTPPEQHRWSSLCVLRQSAEMENEAPVATPEADVSAAAAPDASGNARSSDVEDTAPAQQAEGPARGARVLFTDETPLGSSSSSSSYSSPSHPSSCDQSPLGSSIHSSGHATTEPSVREPPALGMSRPMQANTEGGSAKVVSSVRSQTTASRLPELSDDARRWVQETTPVKQSLSGIRPTTASQCHHHPLAAVASTPDGAHGHAAGRPLTAGSVYARVLGHSGSKRLPSEAAVGDGRSPQELPSCLVTPNPFAVSTGLSPHGWRTVERGSPRGTSARPECRAPRSSAYAAAAESTPTGRFTGFPSPVQLSPIPTKGTATNDFYAQLREMGGGGGSITFADGTPWRVARAFFDEPDFRPEYVSSSASSSSSTRGADCGGCAPHLAATLAAEARPSGPASPVPESTNASLTQKFNPTDSTQPPPDDARTGEGCRLAGDSLASSRSQLLLSQPQQHSGVLQPSPQQQPQQHPTISSVSAIFTGSVNTTAPALSALFSSALHRATASVGTDEKEAAEESVDRSLRFSALPIPGMLSRSSMPGSRVGSAESSNRHYTSSLTVPRRSQLRSPDADAHTLDGSSPSKLYMDYYYSSHRKSRSRLTVTDLSLTTTTVNGTEHGHTTVWSTHHHGDQCTAPLDSFTVSPSVGPVNCAGSLSTVFETVSSIRSSAPEETAERLRHTRPGLLSPPSVGHTSSTFRLAETTHQAWKEEASRRLSEQRSQPQLPHDNMDPSRDVLFRTEISSAAAKFARARYDRVAQGYDADRKLEKQPSRYRALDTFR